MNGGWGPWSWQPTSRRCRNCGLEKRLGSAYGAFRLHQARWWGIPWRLGRAILRRRTMVPSPLIYLSALAIGVLVGAAMDAWLGWSWWLFAPLMVVTVWLVFLVSAIPRLGELRSIRMELLDVVDPKGWLDRQHRELERVFRICPFTLYRRRGRPSELGGACVR
jgi:hypothetical protein